MHRHLILILVSVISFCARSEALIEKENVAYRSGNDLSEYAATRCKLDLYLPAGKKDFPLIVWFHGGALEEGDKSGAKKMGRSLAAEGVGVASVNYRMSPTVQYPVYIEDAAAASAWILKNAAEHGADPKRIYISGHSAGGYLALMLALNDAYFKKHELTPASFAGYLPVAGQTVTHSTVRKERGIDKYVIVVDDAAPLRFVRKDAPPILLLAAEKDMVGRVEETELLYANLKGIGNKTVRYLKVPGRDHGSVGGKIAEPGDPGRAAMLEFMGVTK